MPAHTPPPFDTPRVKTLIAEDQIRTAVRDLGAVIAEEYAGRPLTLLGVLHGSLLFLADLMRQIDLPHRVGLVQASSYRGEATRPGELQIDHRPAAGHHRPRRAAGRRHLRHRPHRAGAARPALPRERDQREDRGAAVERGAERGAGHARLPLLPHPRHVRGGATAWTTTTSTGTCPTSRRWTRTSVRSARLQPRPRARRAGRRKPTRSRPRRSRARLKPRTTNPTPALWHDQSCRTTSKSTASPCTSPPPTRPRENGSASGRCSGRCWPAGW